MNQKFEKLGFYPADILLPKGQDMTKWAVVACDQFTSEPEYWQAVEQQVGDAPSTLRLILPGETAAPGFAAPAETSGTDADRAGDHTTGRATDETAGDGKA